MRLIWQVTPVLQSGEVLLTKRSSNINLIQSRNTDRTGQQRRRHWQRRNDVLPRRPCGAAPASAARSGGDPPPLDSTHPTPKIARARPPMGVGPCPIRVSRRRMTLSRLNGIEGAWGRGSRASWIRGAEIDRDSRRGIDSRCRATRVADQDEPDCDGQFRSIGHNFLGAAGRRCHFNTDFSLEGDQVGTISGALDPQLGCAAALVDRPSYRPVTGSPLFDRGADVAPIDARVCARSPNDQQGRTRSQCVRCEIGAVEF